jgi:hypothetical protein
MTYITDNEEIRRLSIEINALAAGSICSWRVNLVNEENLHFIYNIFCEIVMFLRTLNVLQDVRFILGWFKDLEPFLRWADTTK